ncbi:hypothetical protein CYMTET_17778 [Cymbomonas tetramitiformis]|uniref:Integrase catalytic domain-containing protein n=1 Tax=Cymbomonas tetramitiformis TaxID=36881 RepID=A0AAE0G9G2_9CHLO|nr:hypothetical protein CYMTET_17778 [Cymbomonas tetramitiformis]
MVRTSLEDSRDWASGLGQTTQALIRAVESFGTLIFDITGGWGAGDGPYSNYFGSTHDSYSHSDFEYDNHPEDQDDFGSMPDLTSSDYDDDPADHDPCGSVPELASSSGSDSDHDDGGDCHPCDAWASGVFSSGMLASGGPMPDLEPDSDSGGSVPDLESASNSDSDGMFDYCDSIPDLDSGSDSGDDYGGTLPSDAWACGLYRTPDAGSVEMACGAHPGRAMDHSVVGKSAVLDSGATKHIFNSEEVFNANYNTEARETFKVVQSKAISSSGSGSVTFAKRDTKSGRMVGLQLLGAHCTPGQPFNLLSVVALEDVGFLVDFGARSVSKGGVVFCFARIGNQYIVHEDYAETLDTYLACAIQHDGDQRDRFDWKFEDTEPHFTTHGPFFLELFASEGNHILATYCTLSDTCFIKDRVGKHFYGNPPFDHDIILKCLQKALANFDKDPVNTKFMFVLPKWVTASWWHLTTPFSIIHECPTGAKIFSAPWESCYNLVNLEPCGEDWVWIEDTKWPVVVLFKDSQTVEQLDLKMLQHVRLGHIGDKPIDHMFAESIPMSISESQYSGSPVQHCPERCIACRLTKVIRPSVKPTGRELSKELGSLVWSDTCGPFKVSAGGYRWFALFVDDSTSWICIYFLKYKSDYLEAFKLYIVEVKRLRSCMGLPKGYHMTLHTDGDSTMVAGQTGAFCKEHGIQQRNGSPYLHENQARVERSHRDVQAMTRTLLLTSGFGVEMWPLAARHVVYILNRIFRKSLDWTSAHYVVYKKHADLSQLRIFGCLAYPFIDPSLREHKLSNRARELKYVGHSEVSSAHLLYDADSGKVVNSGMVTYSEVSSAYLLYDADSGKVVNSGMVTFPEVFKLLTCYMMLTLGKWLTRVWSPFSEVSSAYLLYDADSGKVVNSGMVTSSERLDKLGKVW